MDGDASQHAHDCAVPVTTAEIRNEKCTAPLASFARQKATLFASMKATQATDDADAGPTFSAAIALDGIVGSRLRIKRRRQMQRDMLLLR